MPEFLLCSLKSEIVTVHQKVFALYISKLLELTYAFYSRTPPWQHIIALVGLEVDYTKIIPFSL